MSNAHGLFDRCSSHKKSMLQLRLWMQKWSFKAIEGSM